MTNQPQHDGPRDPFAPVFTSTYSEKPDSDDEPFLWPAAGFVLLVVGLILLICSPAIVIATYRVLL